MSHTEDVAFDRPLPLIPLRVGVALPGRVTTIPLGRERSVALGKSVAPGDLVALGIQRDREVEAPGLADMHDVAVVARVKDRQLRGRRGVILAVEGLARFRPVALVQTDPFWTVQGEALPDEEENSDEAVALADALRDRVLELVPDEPKVRHLVSASAPPGRLADAIASWLDTESDGKIDVLRELHVPTRLRLVSRLLSETKARAELRQKIDSEVRRELSKDQKNALLRHQLRAIQKELGDGDGGEENPLRDKLEDKELPEEVQKVVDRELARLEGMPEQMAEANVIRRYLEFIAELPWTERADDSLDIDEVTRVLEAEHFGLDEVKRRILEHMAVLKLTAQARGTILCLVGPPGVGKTSLAQSVASATGRPLARVSLGGVRDEAEIRGHRRTYVGSLPGRILNALAKAGVKNPVVVLDEIDKLGRGWNGDPEAALLEVLDPEQNSTFTDHYLELPFDLSEVLFIATANELGTLSAPLRDRLEIIEISGYTTDEKVRIGQEHLLPKQLERHGLDDEAMTLTDEVMTQVVTDYTREAGVRQLSRQLAKLCRSVALEVARGDGEVEPALDEEKARKILGRPRFLNDVAERTAIPGVAAGLAWTPVGGDILYIETTRMPGKGRIEITGQLGDVMTESARAALAYLRSHADEQDIDPDFLETTDLHIHVPAGAVPKDGPSAGVTMFSALASLLTGRRVRSDTAMTGEATLRGRVLPVGGIKSKVLAAHRAGFSRVILPSQNERDLEDIPEAVRDDLEIILATEMSTVLDEALEPLAQDGPDLGPPSDLDPGPAQAA